VAWTAPMTAVSGTFTAAQWNTHVRDNLNETAVAKSTTYSQYFVTTGANAIAARKIASNINNTAGTSTSTTYADIATSFGPSVTVQTGTAAIVWWCCEMFNSTLNAYNACSVQVSGASSVAAADSFALEIDGYGSVATSQQNRYSIAHHFTGLTPGMNTFTMKYRVGSGTGTFDQRVIIVMPL
jgi:hypothetical protein